MAVQVYLNTSNDEISSFCSHRNELGTTFITVDQCYEFWVMVVIPTSFRLAQNDEIPSFEIPIVVSHLKIYIYIS